MRISSLNFLPAIALIALIILPIALPHSQYPFLINTVLWTLFYAYCAASWNILSGYAGQFSFGHTAFFGIGAYTTAVLWLMFNITPWIGLIVGAIISASASLVIGLPSLRLKGHYFVLITIAFSEILRWTFTNWRYVGGAIGLSYKVYHVNSIEIFQFNVDRTPYYYIILAMLVVNIAAIYWIRRSKWGYYFVAIREDEDVAQVSGINLTKYKLWAAAISAMFTSVAGTYYSQFVLYINPETTYSLNLMIKMFLPAALGGMGTILGPVIGSFIAIPIWEYTRVYFAHIQGFSFITFGIILVIVAVAMPSGIMGILSRRLGRRTSV